MICRMFMVLCIAQAQCGTGYCQPQVVRPGGYYVPPVARNANALRPLGQFYVSRQVPVAQQSSSWHQAVMPNGETRTVWGRQDSGKVKTEWVLVSYEEALRIMGDAKQEASDENQNMIGQSEGIVPVEGEDGAINYGIDPSKIRPEGQEQFPVLTNDPNFGQLLVPPAEGDIKVQPTVNFHFSFSADLIVPALLLAAAVIVGLTYSRKETTR